MPTPPPDPPPSISAAELRRRLLSSTPPPLGMPTPGPAPASASDTDVVPLEAARGSGTLSPTEQLLKKLRTPSQSNIALPAGGMAAPDPAANLRAAPAGARFGAPVDPYGNAPGYGEMPSAELARLRNENRELRQLLDEMKTLLQEASDSEQTYAQAKKQLEVEMADRLRQIEELTDQLRQIEEQISNGELAPATPAAPAKTKTELEEWADELEQEASRVNQQRKQLDDDRRQLREDEEALEKQMRDMEVGMARERALMARQETELKRLSAEIQHELELMQRGDVQLREQMQKFQRRAQEVMAPKPQSSSGISRWPGGR